MNENAKLMVSTVLLIFITVGGLLMMRIGSPMTVAIGALLSVGSLIATLIIVRMFPKHPRGEERKAK